MEIRNIKREDAYNYLDMLLNLDKETKNMMFEPNEWSADIEKYINKGIGNKLFCESDKWARENNIKRLELSVICTNVIAKHLYEKNGFVIEGVKKNAMIIDGEYVDEFYMAKLY